jgi:sensor c-di-GMP phosphodiesterase-like protein
MLIVFAAIGGTVFFAYERSMHDQRTRAGLLADEIQRRIVTTAAELTSGFASMQGVPAADACSEQQIIRMRRIALAAPYLAGFGYVTGNALRCSSFGAQSASVDIGAPDYVSVNGYVVRSARELEIAPGTPLVMTSAPDGFTGFFTPAMILTLTSPEDAISLGSVAYSSTTLLMSAGPVQFDWSRLKPSADHPSSDLVVGGSLLAIRKSEHWDTFSYAAVPIAAVNAEFQGLLPAFLTLGIILAAAGVFIARQLMSQMNSMASLLRLGLRRNQIFMEFQPIVDMRTGRWVGAEALARWRLGSGEIVPPDVFIPLAEEHDLIGEITETAIILGLGQIADLLRTHPDLFVSINVSSIDLARGEVVHNLEAAAARHALAASNIHVEITERKSVDAHSQVATISQLREKGFHVGTDDFGVGFSNLGYLTHLPLDYIKIDRSLMISAFHGEAPFDIVETVVRLARARGIRIIAEGVETEAQRLRLIASGVTYGQGWLFGKSMSPLEFVAQFARSASNTSVNRPLPADLAAMPRRAS